MGNFSLNSPDGKIDLQISLVDSTLNYQVNWSGHEILGMSKLEIFPESEVTILNSQIVEHEPIGPLSLSGFNDYQLSEAKNGVKRNISVPLLVETPEHLFVALLESDLYAANGFSAMKLGVNLEQGKVESILHPEDNN